MLKTTDVIACSLLLILFGFDYSAVAGTTFTDIAGQLGFAKVTPSEGDMPVFPYRGSLAIVPSRHGNTWPVMVRNGTGGSAKFSQVFSVLPTKEDGHGCTAADVTNPSLSGRDGLVDLICTKGACQGTCSREYRKELWVQKPGGGFVNLAQAAGIAQPHSRGRDTSALSLTDGRVVVAFANERSPNYPAESIDRAYISVNGKFTELPLQNAAGTGRSNTAGSCVVAMPRSGTLPDLLFCDDSKVNAYHYDGGQYRLTAAYGNFFALDLLVADFDLDSQPDVLALMNNKLTIRRGGTQSVTIATPKNAHGLAYGDMDCDGRADILVVQTKAVGNAHMLLLNNGSGLSYRAVPFPHPTNGSGDAATYVANWNGAGQPAMLISHGLYSSGPTSFIAASCSK